MAEHRVTMLGASLRRFGDPARSRDPRIRSLVAKLATLEPAPEPRAHFRAELRAQLVAVAPRLVAEGPTIESHSPVRAAGKPAHAAAPARSRLGGAAGWTSRISIGRPLVAVTAVIAVFAMLLGGAVWVSKKALPGDALYSLKRANENVALSLVSGDTAKGHEYLKLAQIRAEEVSALVSRTSSMSAGPGPNAAGGINAHTAKLITSTLDSADSDVLSGAKLLNIEAVSSGSDDPLAIMIGWAPGQVDRLKKIAQLLGRSALQTRVDDSVRLTATAYARATGLEPKLGCTCLQSAPSDEFGPKPCTTCTAVGRPGQQPGTSTGPGAPHQSPTKGGNPGSTGGGGGGPTNGLPVTQPNQPSSPSVPSTGGGGIPVSVPLSGLPSLPITLPGGQSTAADGSTPTPTCLVYALGICISFG